MGFDTPLTLIIGAYVITGMVALISRKGERSESEIAKIFASITILITIYAAYLSISAYIVIRTSPFR